MYVSSLTSMHELLRIQWLWPLNKLFLIINAKSQIRFMLKKKKIIIKF